jgi:hypothetical protein
MHPQIDQRVSEAFNSMLRTDYIALGDIDKMNLLSQYYVDYFGYLPQVLSETDQLVVGRRGTGKTTLLYRAFVECMRSWGERSELAKSRTLGIYIDLSKCQSLYSTSDFTHFEHMFVSEMCQSISDQLKRFWPELERQPGVLDKLFNSANQKKQGEVKKELENLATLLKTGLPRMVSHGTISKETTGRNKRKDTVGVDATLSAIPKIGVKGSEESESEYTEKVSGTEAVAYRLSVSDIFGLLQSLREKAQISAIFVFIDEYSSLSTELQGRFSSLLRKMLGAHAGLFLKLCAITDNYTLGSSIILQRDLFEISLDLDAFVERSNNLGHAMTGLREHTERIVRKRLQAYECQEPELLFADMTDVWIELSRASLGVPRTLGIVLQQAWNRRRAAGTKIRKTDVEYGIRYASKAYLTQMLGASRDNAAIPSHITELWFSLQERATEERQKENREASHFLLTAKFEPVLKYLNMFFLVHLLTKGRTTKKDSSARSLYCFDYGICLENNLGFTLDKNVLRQQRFVYDDVIVPYYERYYQHSNEPIYECTKCRQTYKQSEIQVAGMTLDFCPKDRADLRLVASTVFQSTFTEEEIKIIGAIRSAGRSDKLLARRVADDVGCFVQKVAKFGEKLERDAVISRDRDDDAGKLIYFSEEKQDN